MQLALMCHASRPCDTHLALTRQACDTHLTLTRHASRPCEAHGGAGSAESGSGEGRLIQACASPEPRGTR